MADQVEKEFERWMNQQVLEMRFDKHVLNEFGEGLGLTKEQVFEEPETLRADSPTPTIAESAGVRSDVILHKSEWLKDVMRDKTAGDKRAFDDLRSTWRRQLIESERGDATDGTRKRTLRMLLKASDAYSTRNVPFMLEVWQRVEGINLEAAMMRYAREEAKQKADARSKMQEFTERVSQSGSRPSSALRKQVSRSSTAEASRRSLGTVPESDVPFWKRPASVGETAGPQTRTISRSTVRLLKKLTREGVNVSEPGAFSPANIENIVRLTLTGPESDAADTGRYSAGPDKTIHRSRLSTGRPSTASRPLKPKSQQSRKRTAYTPGAWKRALETADPDLETLNRTTPGTGEWGDNEGSFRLVIPHVADVRDEDDLSTELGEARTTVAIRNVRPSVGVRKSVSVADASYMGERGGDAISVGGASNLLGFRVSMDKPAPRISERSMTGKLALAAMHPFSIVRFVSMVKRIAKANPVRKPPPPPLPGSKPNTTTASAMSDVTDFLLTPYTGVELAPAVGTPAHEALTKAFLLALREENDRILRFEACRLLILIEGHHSLGRWDTIAFRNVLTEMLNEGTEDERALASSTLCDMNLVDRDVLLELRSRLGDIDTKKRARAMELLADMDEKYIEDVMGMLLEDAGSTNWRIRRDAILLLGRWLQRLSPVEAAEVPSYLELEQGEESDDDVGELLPETEGVFGSQASLSDKAPVMDGTSSSAEISKEAPPKKEAAQPKSPTSARRKSSANNTQTSRPSSKPQSAALRKYPSQELTEEELRAKLRKHFIQSSLQTLLKVMWNDWNPDVRETASSTLGRLDKGASIFNSIIELLEAEDPLKRIDALKYLTRLGVMTSASLPMYLKCFEDSFATVRVEACKVACALATNHRQLIDCLLDKLNDFDWKVRAYAIKALGFCKCKEAKNREAMRWAILHESHPSVRGEAINAARNLGLVTEDQQIKDATFTAMETDRSSAVRKVAEQVLIALGIMYPSGIMVESDSGGTAAAGGMSTFSVPASAGAPPAAATTRITSTPTVPYPHILQGRRPSEQQVFLAESLVGEREQAAVIDQVQSMSDKQKVIGDVANMDWGMEEVEEETTRVAKEHMPELDAIHHPPPRTRIDTGIGEIVRRKPGVPYRSVPRAGKSRVRVQERRASEANKEEHAQRSNHILEEYEFYDYDTMKRAAE
ncbi:HEAT repeat-containing protein 4 [Rhizophlyctis rosea]|nr:HEAT repeat-containing protein 4 [Rhizophlyctis rosea]